jgi:hypothetical protein
MSSEDKEIARLREVVITPIQNGYILSIKYHEDDCIDNIYFESWDKIITYIITEFNPIEDTND